MSRPKIILGLKRNTEWDEWKITVLDPVNRQYLEGPAAYSQDLDDALDIAYSQYTHSAGEWKGYDVELTKTLRDKLIKKGYNLDTGVTEELSTLEHQRDY